jgi:hypothetical protein
MFKCSELLHDLLLLSIVHKLVPLEQGTLVEGGDIVNVLLASLQAKGMFLK